MNSQIWHSFHQRGHCSDVRFLTLFIGSCNRFFGQFKRRWVFTVTEYHEDVYPHPPSPVSLVQTLYYYGNQNDTWPLKLTVRKIDLYASIISNEQPNYYLGRCYYYPRRRPSSFYLAHECVFLSQYYPWAALLNVV